VTTYNNLDSLYKALGKQIEVSLNKTANDLVELATKLIWEEFYQAYNPKVYERSYRLLNSVMKTNVKKSNNTYSVEIYLDPSGVDYNSIDALQAFLLASEGYHGNRNIQTDGKFWESFMNETIKSWKTLLIQHGLNVV
jgi:hypothetical protein